MKILNIEGAAGTSVIRIGDSLKNLGQYIAPENTVIITDTHVYDIYKDAFPPCSVIQIGTGEKIKTLETVSTIYKQLTELGAQRSTFIVGIGGGIVCDISGFVASTYLRGLRFGFVATTLLAQVDASVGGKNGVNFGGYKNMVGVFNQPEFVICDPALLQTLPERDRLSGFAEIVKHAAIADTDMFAFLENNADRALSLEADVIERLVYDSVVIKSTIVNRDEKEQGERRKLNFGHTFGHALEKATGITHGEAVSVGMVIAAALSVQKGRLTSQDADRLNRLLVKLKLPVHIDYDKQTALDALGKDKKRTGDAILFVLLDGLGHAVVETIALQELQSVLDTVDPFDESGKTQLP